MEFVDVILQSYLQRSLGRLRVGLVRRSRDLLCEQLALSTA